VYNVSNGLILNIILKQENNNIILMAVFKYFNIQTHFTFLYYNIQVKKIYNTGNIIPAI